MKPEEWPTVLGFFAVIMAIVFALLPENLWLVQRLDPRRPDPAAQAAQAALLPASPGEGGVWQSPAQVFTAAAVQPMAQKKRTIRAQPGLMPFEQAARVRFNGTIQQISELQQQDGQIHLWLNDPQGREQHLSVAPSWFLQYAGCTLVHDAAISGVGFQFDKTKTGMVRRGAVMYVKKLVVGKTVCHLRNDEGFALWSNQLR